jgi:hypothetical protein
MPVEVKWGISFLIGGLILFLGWKVPFILLFFPFVFLYIGVHRFGDCGAAAERNCC